MDLAMTGDFRDSFMSGEDGGQTAGAWLTRKPFKKPGGGGERGTGQRLGCQARDLLLADWAKMTSLHVLKVSSNKEEDSGKGTGWRIASLSSSGSASVYDPGHDRRPVHVPVTWRLWPLPCLLHDFGVKHQLV